MGEFRLEASGTRTFPQPSWQPAAPPRAAAATLGNTGRWRCSHALGTAAEMTLPSLHSLLCVCPRADQAEGDQQQAGQGGSEGPAGAQGLRVHTFLYSSSSTPALARSAAAATKEKSPSASIVKKQAFILHVLLTVTAWRHSLAKVIMKQIKSQTQASLFPTPKRVNIVQNSIYRENSQKWQDQKTPLQFRRKRSRQV